MQEDPFTTLLTMHTTPRDSQPRTLLQTCTTNKAAVMEQGNNCTNNYPQDLNPAPRCTGVWDLLMAGRKHTYIHWPFPFPSGSDPVDDAIFIAFQNQTNIGWSQVLRDHFSSQWGQAMAQFMHHRHPHQTFQPANWTRTVIRYLREYSYSQWTERNSHICGINQAASQALHRQALQQKITEAYNNIPSIPSNKQPFTFDTPLTTRILQPTTLLRAWLLQYQAGQHRLSRLLKQEQCNQGKITKFLIICTTGRCTTNPPD